MVNFWPCKISCSVLVVRSYMVNQNAEWSKTYRSITRKNVSLPSCLPGIIRIITVIRVKIETPASCCFMSGLFKPSSSSAAARQNPPPVTNRAYLFSAESHSLAWLRMSRGNPVPFPRHVHDFARVPRLLPVITTSPHRKSFNSSTKSNFSSITDFCFVCQKISVTSFMSSKCSNWWSWWWGKYRSLLCSLLRGCSF